MVRRELEFTVGSNIVCRAGELLTLTTDDAMMPDESGKPILASGVFDSVEALVEALGYTPAATVRVEVTMAELFARFIESFPISGFIMGIGLLLLYIESRTPGFGVPGLLGVGMLLLWFWGHHIAGLAGMGELLLFALGLILLGIELFVLPGFGITGIAGIALIVVSLILAMIDHYPGTPVFSVPKPDVTRAVMNLSTAVVFAFFSALLLGRILPNTPFYRALVLQTEQKHEKGYSAGIEGGSLLGKRGTALTDLRPSGIADIEGERLGVQTEGPFIVKGTPVVVKETMANRIVVVEVGSLEQAARA
jgi:membrane-bound serine protease (ClpP class)